MILKAFFKGIFISTRDFAKQWIIGDIYLLTHIVHQSAAFVISVTSFKLLPQDFWTSLPTAAPLSTWAPPPPGLQACLVVTIHKNAVFHLGFQSVSPTCHFYVFFFLPDLSQIYFHLLPPTVLCSLPTACFMTSCFTADFFTLSTVCEWRWYQNITTGFLLVSFTLSKRQALCIPYIDSSHIKTS